MKKVLYRKPAVFLALLILVIAVCVIKDTADTETTDAVSTKADGTKEIALTFDDGPHPKWTPLLLEGLKQRGVFVTFFVIGESAKKYPKLIQQMEAQGHQIGNHTYSHVQLTRCPVSHALSQIQKTQEVIQSITKKTPKFIRPPFGSWNEVLAEKTSLTAVLWDVDPYDWKNQDCRKIVDSIKAQTKDQSIILLHDVYETSVQAALEIVDYYQNLGYRFCRVDEIFIE